MTILEKEIQEARDRFAKEYAKPYFENGSCNIVDIERHYRMAWDKALEIGRELGKAEAYGVSHQHVMQINEYEREGVEFETDRKKAEEWARKLLGGV